MNTIWKWGANAQGESNFLKMLSSVVKQNEIDDVCLNAAYSTFIRLLMCNKCAARSKDRGSNGGLDEVEGRIKEELSPV